MACGTMSESVVQLKALRFAYGRREVLAGVDLDVPKGSIFGFLGRNGAGKTTTIKLLLGLLRPTSGECRVLGYDSVRDRLAVRRAVGYMAEDQRMYGWMTVAEIIRWVASLYPVWDDGLVDSLREGAGLDPGAKVKTLSKGQNTSLALLLALGHRPELVILDDPTLGLDPIARKEFLRYVIDLLQGRGITVFFSSHLLYEIEPVADTIAILDGGVIVKSGATDVIREGVRRFLLTPRAEADLTSLGGILDVTVGTGGVSITVEDCDDHRRAAVRELSANGCQEIALNLDEVFEAYVIGNRGRSATADSTLAASVSGEVSGTP